METKVFSLLDYRIFKQIMEPFFIFNKKHLGNPKEIVYDLDTNMLAAYLQYDKYRGRVYYWEEIEANGTTDPAIVTTVMFSNIPNLPNFKVTLTNDGRYGLSIPVTHLEDTVVYQFGVVKELVLELVKAFGLETNANPEPPDIMIISDFIEEEEDDEDED